jgi:exoribonuclease R
VLTFTIDPEDAKDFDDAISYEVLKDGTFEIGVAYC